MQTAAADVQKTLRLGPRGDPVGPETNFLSNVTTNTGTPVKYIMTTPLVYGMEYSNKAIIRGDNDKGMATVESPIIILPLISAYFITARDGDHYGV